MDLFNRDSDEDEDDNCSHHHWGEYEDDIDSIHTRVYEDTLDFRSDALTRSVDIVNISVPSIAHCQHEGCDATDREAFNNRTRIPMAVVESKIDVRVIEDLFNALEGDLREEIASGILQRAQDIHDNPDDEFEETAEELRDLGHRLQE